VQLNLGHPRFVALRFEGSPRAIWRGIAQHGRPIQYAYVHAALALWDVWTPIAATPAAFEAPSAGFALDWRLLSELRERGVRFATITHAAGISSTGDPTLDRLLPLDEPYLIPRGTVDAVAKARKRGGRIVAIGTSVVRGLEAAATAEGLVHPGAGVATQRIDARTRLRIVDVIVSGTHEPGTSHFALLGAFVAEAVLEQAGRELDARGYRTHEFGDSVLIERSFTSRSDASLDRPCRQTAHDRALREEEQHERG
jgi:S-adenosylmethionine:tRNA ribosyltransferase-isomerase